MCNIINKIKKYIKIILYKIVDISLYKIKTNNSEEKKLLIIRIDAIGDFILFSPFIKYYKKKYNNYHITIIVNDFCKNLLKNNKYIDEIIYFNKKKFCRNIFYRRAILKCIKKKHFDIVIYPTYSRELTGDVIVKHSGAKEKISFDGDLCNIDLKTKIKNNIFYTNLIKIPQNITSEIERNKLFAEQLGLKLKNYMPKFKVDKHTLVKATNLLEKNGLLPNKKFVVINLGARWFGKIWPLEKFVKLIIWLKKYKDMNIVICGSKIEKKLGKKLKQKISFKIIDIIGQTDLNLLTGVLKKSSLYIGNDSGIVHLAVAVNIPVVCIMGGGHFKRFFPYGDLNRNRIVYHKMECFNCNWKCIYKTKKNSAVPCISKIKVKDVINEIKILLKNNKL